MKIDFRKIEVKDIDGGPRWKKVKDENGELHPLEGVPEVYDISKDLGNVIYNNTPDLGEMELGREIYRNGEVDIDAQQAVVLNKYIRMGLVAFIQESVCPILDNIINQNQSKL
ncbi:MAG: hypothetical protein RR471_12935 [Bacteroides sp.]